MEDDSVPFFENEDDGVGVGGGVIVTLRDDVDSDDSVDEDELVKFDDIVDDDSPVSDDDVENEVALLNVDVAEVERDDISDVGDALSVGVCVGGGVIEIVRVIEASSELDLLTDLLIL